MTSSTDFYAGASCQVVEIVAGDEKQSWTRVQTATNGALTDWGVRLLRSGLDKYVASVLIEPAYVCKDYRNLYSHFYSKKFLPWSPHCNRLHFFNKHDLSLEDIVFRSDEHQTGYIGYSVVEPVVERCIGRTVVDPVKLGKPLDRFFCLRTPTKVRIQGANYTVDGFPYRSQSGEATVCAHTALWSACRYLSERYPAYRELYPFDLIEMTGDTNGRRVPYRGMTYFDYSAILSEFGCHPAIIRPRGTDTGKGKDWSIDPEAFYDLYAYVESGFPVLTSFGGHVVNLIGHTLTDDIQPKHEAVGSFYNSAALLKEYIVVDDNFFPYQLLAQSGAPQYYPAGAYRAMQHPPSIDSVFAAVVPLAEKAYLRPGDCRRSTYKFLQHREVSLVVDETLRDLNCAGEPLVVRQLLTSSSAFKRRKREYFAPNGTDRLLSFPIGLNLPHFIWVMELTSLSLFNNRQCFGEVVVDATMGIHDLEPIYCRIGRFLMLGSQKQRDNAAQPCYAQYTHNLGRP